MVKLNFQFCWVTQRGLIFPCHIYLGSSVAFEIEKSFESKLPPQGKSYNIKKTCELCSPYDYIYITHIHMTSYDDMYNTISDMRGIIPYYTYTHIIVRILSHILQNHVCNRTHAYTTYCNIKQIISYATAHVISCDVISIEYQILL